MSTPDPLRNRTPGRMIPSHTAPTDPAPPPARARRYITELTVDTPGSAARPDAEVRPSRWRTPEFKFYGLVFACVVPLLVYWPMRLSSNRHPNYSRYAYKLSPGWLFGRKVDNSDAQYRSFRSNLLSLLALASVQLGTSLTTSRLSPSPRSRAVFVTVFATLMLTALHGVSTIKIFAILYTNYQLATMSKAPWFAKVWPALVIVGNMVLLFFNHKYEGYRFGSLHEALGELDEFCGLLPRWHINFNITMMRIVSFALDYHWRQPSTEVPNEYKKRVSTSLPEKDYNLLYFFAYILYSPLYIAGPIMTFNDFTWQLRNPVSISVRERVAYTCRFLVCLFTMELVLHTMYVVAIKDTLAWEGDSPADLCMIGFWNLAVVWLKLLIPWRFFRLWALLDGVDPPENMVRCVANNYSALGFWRSWHRSYNLWVVRYIYVPLGGSRNAAVATLMVFTFVALWHDLSLKLLAWGWLISLFILPELVARKLAPPEKYGHYGWYRHVAAAAAVLNILMMMSANLVGFVLGLDGMKHLVWQLALTQAGWVFTLFASFCLFVGVQCMFEYREEERRRAIDRRC